LNPTSVPASMEESPGPTQLLKKQLTWYFLLRVIFLTLILGITAVLEAKGHRLPSDKLHYPLLFIGGVYLFTIASAALAARVREPRRFATLQIIFDILLISTLVFFSGTSHSLFTVAYFPPIIVAGFMLFKRCALLMAAISTITYGTMLFLEFSQYSFDILISAPRPAASLERLLNLLAINGISFFLVAALATLLATRLSRTEEALSRTTNQFDRLTLLYKQIFDDITTGIITVDQNWVISSFNRAAEKITGYQAAEAVGRRMDRIFPGIKPAEELAATGRAETKLVRKDGEQVPVGYSWSRLYSARPEENNFILSLQDLSRIREMEAKVRQSEKMAAVGEMAAGIAHEFRNPLAAISGSAQLLEQRLKDQPAQEKLLRIISRECDRLEAAVRNFLLFSRPARPRQEWLQLKEVIHESATLLGKTPTWGPRHRLELDFPDQTRVWADRDQLKQILLNLLSNACQAMPDGGTISCNASPAWRDDQQVLLIRLRDNGPGLDPAIRRKIFDPYFTTRQDGTGLGLAIVHQIISGHGGSISVESSPGQGTLFVIQLPNGPG
ncbi:MAG TPA: PAS domain S-box protein, partial [Desulfurivibrio alkaliphilus]|nr:PAS domain S-box protein [Desulfurivibrio alkaliphilus]